VRPAWSAGTAYAPLAWHVTQSARPSSVCGIAVGVGGGVGGAGGAAGGAGGGVGAGAAQAATSGTTTSIATTNNHSTDLVFTKVTSQFIIGYFHYYSIYSLAMKGETKNISASPF